MTKGPLAPLFVAGLTYLDLSENGFTGALPGSWQALSSLVSLDLSENGVTVRAGSACRRGLYATLQGCQRAASRMAPLCITCTGYKHAGALVCRAPSRSPGSTAPRELPLRACRWPQGPRAVLRVPRDPQGLTPGSLACTPFFAWLARGVRLICRSSRDRR